MACWDGEQRAVAYQFDSGRRVMRSAIGTEGGRWVDGIVVYWPCGRGIVVVDDDDGPKGLAAAERPYRPVQGLSLILVLGTTAG